VIESSCFCRTQYSLLVFPHRFTRGREKPSFRFFFSKGTCKTGFEERLLALSCLPICLSVCSLGTTLLGPDGFCRVLYCQFVLKFVDIYPFLLRRKFPTLDVTFTSCRLRTGNWTARGHGETLNDLNITAEHYTSFHARTKLMIAFTSVLNMALRFRENLRRVFLKACEVTFKVLALSIFLKLLTNLKSGDNNRKRAPHVLRPVDVLSLCE
jgi:hypothetical protein